MEDDGGGKGSEYVLMADNVITPVHNDNMEKVSKLDTFLRSLGIYLVMVQEKKIHFYHSSFKILVEEAKTGLPSMFSKLSQTNFMVNW